MGATRFVLDSYCGHYCGACDVLRGYEVSLESGRPARREDLPPAFSEHLVQAEIRCAGCRSDLVFAGCSGCGIRDCARAKGVETCTACPEYPCPDLRERRRFIAEHPEEVMPHSKVKFRNLDQIREMGRDWWLSDQRRKWSCPDCGARFTWYSEKCSQCGRELESVKDYNRL